MAAEIRVKDLPNTDTLADGDELLADGTTTKRIAYGELKTQLASEFVAAPSTFKLAPLDGSNKVPNSYLPTSVLGSMVYKGQLAGASVPATSTAAGDYYVITSAGTSQSITWAVGDLAVYKGSSGQWDKFSPGVTQVGAGGTGATTAAQARTNLGVFNQAQSLGVGNGEDGLVFSGVNTASQYVRCEMTGQSPGTTDFSVRLRMRGPAAATSSTPSLFWLGSSGSTPVATRSLWCYYDPSSHVYVRLYGATTADFRTMTFTGLRSACAGTWVELAFVRSAGTLKVFVNGDQWTSTAEATAGTPPAWSDLVQGDFFCLGTHSSGASNIRVRRCDVFNTALTASDALAIMTDGLPFKWRFGTNAEKITAAADRDFSGANNWANTSMATFDAATDLSVSSNASAQTCQLSGAQFGGVSNGKAYRFACAAANATGASFELRLANQGTIATLVNGANAGEFVATATSGTDALQVYSTGTGSIDLDDFTVKQVGCILSLDCQIGVGWVFPDLANNQWCQAATASADTSHVKPRTGGEYTVRRAFAHSDISATAATTKLFDMPPNVAILDIEIDRNTAFDASTTLDVGISGTQAKHASAVNVATTGKVLTDSLSKVSESSSAATPIFIKKNQATTQGSIVVRVRCAIRGL